MTDPSTTLWLQTFLALAGLGLGIMLHLKWHPLRESLSDAWDMLQSFGWLVPMMAALQLMSEPLSPWFVPYPEGIDTGMGTWQQLLEVLPVAAQSMAALTHGFFPSWPVALALPLALSLLVWRVKRFPYRYDSRRNQPMVLRILLGGVGLAWCWLGMEIVSGIKPMTEWLETLRVLFRWLAEAWMMAGLQVFMIQLVMGWEDPVEPDDQKDLWLAMERVLSKWRGVVALASLDLLWLLAWRSLEGSKVEVSQWLVVESALFFAVVPLVIAWRRGPVSVLLEIMMRVFLKTWLSLLGFAITATILLMLVHFSVRGLFSMAPETALWTGMIRILIALVLATVRSWLFLTLVITLLRHGLKAVAPQERSN